MLSIGEFSRVTQLSIKALRLYHEKGILVPDKIDVESKYRYYRHGAVEKGFIIRQLRDMGFSLNEIFQIVRECDDDSHLVLHVKTKLTEIQRKIQAQEELKDKLTAFLDRTGSETIPSPEQIQHETVPDMPICSIRFSGKYCESGQRFQQLGRLYGKWLKGKPFSLYHDGDYKENDADIEACFPIKEHAVLPVIDHNESGDTLTCRTLKGGKAITIIHRGPYHNLGQSYGKLFEYYREQHLNMILPLREQYIKGPGMIFRGNPKKYVTRLIMMVE